MRLHHVQVSCPEGGEDAARRFYGDALGIPEVAKPPVLAARGGCWFRADAVEVHVGVEASYTPAKKAHPAFLVDDIDAKKAELEAEGVTFFSEVNVVDEGVLAGWRWVYFADPDGYPLELVEVAYYNTEDRRQGIAAYLASR